MFDLHNNLVNACSNFELDNLYRIDFYQYNRKFVLPSLHTIYGAYIVQEPERAKEKEQEVYYDEDVGLSLDDMPEPIDVQPITTEKVQELFPEGVPPDVIDIEIPDTDEYNKLPEFNIQPEQQQPTENDNIEPIVYTDTTFDDIQPLNDQHIEREEKRVKTNEGSFGRNPINLLAIQHSSEYMINPYSLNDSIANTQREVELLETENELIFAPMNTVNYLTALLYIAKGFPIKMTTLGHLRSNYAPKRDIDFKGNVSEYAISVNNYELSTLKLDGDAYYDQSSVNVFFNTCFTLKGKHRCANIWFNPDMDDHEISNTIKTMTYEYMEQYTGELFQKLLIINLDEIPVAYNDNEMLIWIMLMMKGYTLVSVEKGKRYQKISQFLNGYYKTWNGIIKGKVSTVKREEKLNVQNLYLKLKAQGAIFKETAALPWDIIGRYAKFAPSDHKQPSEQVIEFFNKAAKAIHLRDATPRNFWYSEVRRGFNIQNEIFMYNVS